MKRTLSGVWVEKPFSAYRGDGPYVFVCYAHEDSDAVFHEIAQLNDYGVNVWYDEGISPGQEWTNELAAAIQGCARVLFLVTPRSVSSEHCRRELNFAHEEGREVVAVHLEPTEVPAGLRLSLNNRQAIFKHELEDVEFRKRLVRIAHGGGPPPTLATGPDAKSPRSRTGLLVAAVAFVAIAIGVGWLVNRAVGPSEPEVDAPTAGEAVAGQPAPDNSIAVLPFVNMSSDPEQEYFSDGISEELLNLLAKNPKLKVVSRSSAFTFKGKEVDIPTVAARLGVAHVLEGSVRKAGNRVRVTTQLIDAQTDTHLWSETYDRELDDIFAIQDEIATQVVEALNVTLFGMATPRRTIDTEAYTLFLQGRHMGQSDTPEALDAAERLLKRAVAIQPDYADAWIWLADVYVGRRELSLMPAEDANRLAASNLERARVADPENANVYAAMALMDMFVDRDLNAAIRHLERGAALEPTNLFVIDAAATLSLNLGRLEDAEALMEHVAAHDPLCANCLGRLAVTYMLQDKLDEASVVHQRMKQLGAFGADQNLVVALVMLLQGRLEQSLGVWQEANPGPFRVYGETITLYSMGRQGEFAAKFHELKDQYGAEYPTMVARVYAWMGELDAAFEWLDRYQVEHPELGPVIGNHWELLSVELKSLHGDPRWHAHLQTLGIAPEQLAAFQFDFPLPE